MMDDLDKLSYADRRLVREVDRLNIRWHRICGEWGDLPPDFRLRVLVTVARLRLRHKWLGRFVGVR